jgi:hypothetical protein
MTKTTLKVFALVTMLSAVGVVSGIGRAVSDTTLEDLARYREWTRLTHEPVPIEIPSAAG